MFSVMTSKSYVCYFWTMEKIVKYFLLAMNKGNISTENASGGLADIKYETCYKNMTNNISRKEILRKEMFKSLMLL